MNTLFSLYAFIFGILIGSFLNVIIARLPLKKDIALTRSECPKCKNKLKWFHNIPIFSFVFLKGKCAFCNERISWRYPLIELMTGLISLWLFPDNYMEIESLGFYVFYFTIACIFICHFFIDLDHYLLLDSLNLYLLAVILPYCILRFPWSYWVMGGLMGFGITFTVTWLFYKIRGQVGLGGGDIKLFGILGLLFGPVGIIFNIFLSCFVGAFVGVTMIALKKTTKDKPMAFGPAILLVASFQIFLPKYAEIIKNLMFGN